MRVQGRPYPKTDRKGDTLGAINLGQRGYRRVGHSHLQGARKRQADHDDGARQHADRDQSAFAVASHNKSFHRHFFLRHSSSYRCAVFAACSRAEATTNLACSTLTLALRAVFGETKSPALVNLFMICPQWSAGDHPITKLCPRSRRSRDKESPHLPGWRTAGP